MRSPSVGEEDIFRDGESNYLLLSQERRFLFATVSHLECLFLKDIFAQQLNLKLMVKILIFPHLLTPARQAVENHKQLRICIS